MNILLHPVYFGPISQYVQLVQADKVIFENEDNYQKQTYRNRMYIYDSNGKLLLNIPIRHSSSLGLVPEDNRHQKYKDVLIENDFEWQKQHWRALKASYQTSPFFEFYEDEIYPLYHKEFRYLMDFNYACLEFVLESLQLEVDIEKTSEFILKPGNLQDYRHLVNAKSKENFSNSRYPQVFEPKHGYLPNLAIIDLLFNEGPNSLAYLQAENVN
ncbi:WbqC family protein [Salegentibacter sp. F188]|uniref:WbqC family protein n=1 Tax=Autumnicola patrickiae TaxID=3075591 RepID=A0ABU3DY25_9FLAO|nr:WbqC family protein [Salegentibacter sp. F188]MDT0688349.1 WbqC family protein [Salegentibacter sp. F188]